MNIEDIKPLPNLERLNELFIYYPKTGYVLSKIVRGNLKIGKYVGTMSHAGYLIVSIDYEQFRLHRIIWKIMTSFDPIIEIDHKNLIKHDNRWLNLRLSTTQQNSYNITKKPYNTTGYKGVSWAKHANKWVAHCRINGIKKHLGYFITPEEASTAYTKAILQNHGDFARA